MEALEAEFPKRGWSYHQSHPLISTSSIIRLPSLASVNEVLFRDDSASFVDSYVNLMIGGGADKSTESRDWKTGTEAGAANVWLSSNSERMQIIVSSIATV